MFQSKNINIPDTVSEIGVNAFYDCKALADNDGFVVIRNVLHGYFGNKNDITVPECVLEISDYVFRDCIVLTNITLLEGVTKIGKHVFPKVKEKLIISIPKSVTEIDNQAFRSKYRSIIYTPEGSYAESYAEAHGIKHIHDYSEIDE